MARFALVALLIATACTTQEEGVAASKRVASLEEGGAAGSGDDITPNADAAEAAMPSADAAVVEVDAAAMEAAGSAAMETAGSAAMETAGSAAMETAGSAAMETAGSAAMETAGSAAMANVDAGVESVDAAMAEPAADAAATTTDAGMESVDAAMTSDSGMGMHEHPMPMDDDAGMEGDGAVDHAEEHCSMEMPPDPRDSLITSSAPVEWTSGTARDVMLPQPVVDWLNEQGLNEAHDAWHATRRWDQTCNVSNAPAEGCRFGQSLVAENLFRAEYQQGAPGAGFAFLHMHRHMLHAFKSAFPTHADLFKSWTHIPRSIDDPENPTPWKTITWTEDNLIGFDIIENIEAHLDMFPTEDDLGNFMESTFRWTPEDPTVATGIAGSAMHGAVHRQFSVRGSPANMGSPATSLPNYSFWKLHGFIDDVWQRYRAAKQLSEDDEYRMIARWECRLMYFLSPLHRQVPPPTTDAMLKRGE